MQISRTYLGETWSSPMLLEWDMDQQSFIWTNQNSSKMAAGRLFSPHSNWIKKAFFFVI